MQIPTVPSYVISKAISQEYKVAISGDGGDELLYGYDRSKFMSTRNFLRYNSDFFDKYYPAYFLAQVVTFQNLINYLN